MTIALPEKPQERGLAVRRYCQASRDAWHKRHRDGTPAVEVAHGLAADMQAVVVAVFERAVAGVRRAPPVALVASGSLGRRELSPYSDLDVAVVSHDPQSEAARAVADALFYPLWDARLDVGHAVRSPEDFARLAQEDDTVRTAAVDWRPLAGDAALVDILKNRLSRALGSGATRRYAKESVRLWTQGGNPGTVYHLQPDVKSGPGGLREVHRLWWLGRLLWKVDSWHDFLSLGLLDRHGLDTLEAGRAALLNLRLAMHFAVGRRQDQLRFDIQDDVAAYLAVPSGPGDRQAAENLLESFYRHAKAVRAVSFRVLERCAENLLPAHAVAMTSNMEGFDLFRGMLTLHRPDQIDTTPADLIRIFRVAQRYNVPVYVRARTLVAAAAAHVINDAFRHNANIARMFVDIVGDCHDGGAALEMLHELGVLELYMPEFSPVTGLAQRDLYHVYTVDAHLVACGRAAAQLLAGTLSTAPPDIQDVATKVARPHVLVLASLMHDIGKGHGHGHSERGAVMAKAACTRLCLSDEDIADVEFLVLEHLAMFRIALRRDLQDAELIQRFAAVVGTVERLDMLLALSYVDAVTTGPEAWNEWKGHLLRELYQRTRQALRSQPNADAPNQQRDAKLAELVALAPQHALALRALAARWLPRHILTHRPTLLLRHFEAVEAASSAAGYACNIAPDERRGGWEIVVVGADRPGLLADLSGVLTAWGVSVDAAYISGTRDNLAIDTFVVRSGSRLLEKFESCTRLADELQRAVQVGPQDLLPRLQERRRAEMLRQSGIPRSKVRVVYDADAQTDATVVDIFAPDRVGFLHDVTSAIFNAGVSITVARITTEGERAVDAFYLVDSSTRAPLDAAQQARVRGVIERAAVEGG